MNQNANIGVTVAYVIPPVECIIHGMGLECMAAAGNEQDALAALRNKWDVLMQGQLPQFDKDAVWQKMMHQHVHGLPCNLGYEIRVCRLDYELKFLPEGTYTILV